MMAILRSPSRSPRARTAAILRRVHGWPLRRTAPWSFRVRATAGAPRSNSASSKIVRTIFASASSTPLAVPAKPVGNVPAGEQASPHPLLPPLPQSLDDLSPVLLGDRLADLP